MARKYFVNLFSTNGVVDVDHILKHVSMCVTDDMIAVLTASILDKEIVDALG